MKLQKEEVDSVYMMSMQEILTRAENGEDFTPDSIYACKEYVKMKGGIESFPKPIGEPTDPILMANA